MTIKQEAIVGDYEVRPRKDHRGANLISDALPFGGLWYGEPNAIENAIDYAKFYSRSHDAVIRVYDDAGNVIETHLNLGVRLLAILGGPHSLWTIGYCHKVRNEKRLL